MKASILALVVMAAAVCGAQVAPKALILNYDPGTVKWYPSY